MSQDIYFTFAVKYASYLQYTILKFPNKKSGPYLEN